MTIVDILQWLEGTWPALLARESLYGFQILVAIHLIGLIASVGTLLWFDLRLLGIGLQRCRVSELYRGLAPWFLTGFGMMFVSGAMLFAGFATAAYGNLYFRIKVAMLVLVGVNAVSYHFSTQRSLPEWDDAPRPPLSARLSGFTSIVLWGLVIVAGRAISYTMF